MELVKHQELARLYENDQVSDGLLDPCWGPHLLTRSKLNLQMVAGLAFPFYSEAKINFMPTYKFDIGTDRYDTS